MGTDLQQVRRTFAQILPLAVLCGLFFVPAAQGVEIIAPQHNPPNAEDGWQAGTCTMDVPECTPEAKDQFFTQAAGHPNVGITQFVVKHGSGLFGAETPVGDVRNLLVDLPAGLSVNPQATPRCELKEGESPSVCETRAPGSQVGTSALTAALVVAGIGKSLTLPASPVYNLVPKEGQPARFGFSTAGNDVFLEPGIDWAGDYHEHFFIRVPKLSLPEIPLLEGVRVLKNRLVFNGRLGMTPGGGGAFLTNPSTCFNPADPTYAHTYSTFLHADSYEEEAPAFPEGAQVLESGLPPGVAPTGCDKVPFDPTTAVDPATQQVDSPSAAGIEVLVPFDPTAGIADSNVKDAVITLPRGMGLNPSAAPGLQMCTEGQFGKGTRTPIGCPDASKIGTAAIETPPLPSGSLTGSLYLGQQLGRDPQSGNVYRVFFDASSSRYDVDVRLIGNVKADPRTGQLTATFPNSPQVPFTAAKAKLARGLLTSPPTCGPNAAAHAMTAWSGSPDQGPREGGFTLAKAPGGGDCPKTLGERPFSPGFSAQPKSNEAKAFTPFMAHLTRPAGQQELKGLDVTLPPGATAKLAGVSYCPPAAIAAARSRSGAEEQAKASCPDDSKIGIATVEAGTGDSPLKIGGIAYLAGPYEGAPLSVLVVTPAVAGPFDLGNVVVRVPLFVDPETAQVHTKTDALPDVFGGAKLDIRSVFLNLNRKEFTLNGTNCAKSATAGVVKGGGSDPTDPVAYSAFPVSDPFQAQNCNKLPFKPKLKIRLFGKTNRAKHPKLRAILTARPGDANIARASVALPHALFLDQASLASVCTRVQFAADQCPRRSVYGHARAITPLLGKPLEGPVYLRSSNNTLPDMVAHLRGQVDIDLVGRIDSFKGGIRTTFDRVPDVPVTKFVLTLPGGKKGLLVNSRSLCAKPVKAIIRIKGQNGKKANRKPKLRTPCKKKHRKHRGGHHKK
jgi:hypothetical protein